MGWLIKSGRVVFAVVIAAFGVQHWMFTVFHMGPKPRNPWPVAGMPWELIALALPFLALGLAFKQTARPVAGALAAVFLLRFLVIYLPQLAMRLRAPGPWTNGSEILAIAGVALVLAGTLSAGRGLPPGLDHFFDKLVLPGRFLLAIPLVVFGVQHFMYANPTAGMVPAWLPPRLFWAYFVGVAFIAAAVSITIKVQARLAATLLGFMFLLIAILIHASDVLVALALWGGAWIVAGSLAKDRARAAAA
jgi:uncharacterized membrane protein YphA (DoxX/SURF4 family)